MLHSHSLNLASGIRGLAIDLSKHGGYSMIFQTMQRGEHPMRATTVKKKIPIFSFTCGKNEKDATAEPQR